MWPRGLSGAAFVALGAFDPGHKGPQSRSPPPHPRFLRAAPRDQGGAGWGCGGSKEGGLRQERGRRAWEGVIHNIYFNNSFKSF